MTDLQKLSDAMTDAALELLLVIGFDDGEQQQRVEAKIDLQAIPAPVLHAAQNALKFLAVGVGLADAPPEEGLFDEAILAALLTTQPGEGHR